MVTCMHLLVSKKSSIAIDNEESLHHEGGLEFEDHKKIKNITKWFNCPILGLLNYYKNLLA